MPITNLPEGGRNKGTKAKPKIVDVETVPCPDGAGRPHLIANTNAGLGCRYCGVPWATLDLQVNGDRS